jgi:hypothetical protein
MSMAMSEAYIPSGGQAGDTTHAAHVPVTVPPMDEYNRTLIANAHPSDWQNPPAGGRYNLVVIGGGTAGLVGA